MKIRITQPGWEGYTGHLGMVEFADGVSVEDISRGDAAALAALVSIEDVSTGKNPSDAQRMIDANGDAAKVETPVAAPAPEAPVATPEKVYTRAELEEVADKGGIKALREIGDTMGVKDNSIVQLIDKIMSWQAENAPKAE